MGEHDCNDFQVEVLDRAYGDDLTRRALLAVFAYLGDAHPLTRAHRTAFSNAVYA